MPMFYFHIMTPTGDLLRADEGLELPDLEAAREEAIEAAASFHKDTARGAPDFSGCTFEVQDMCGRQVLTVPFGETRNAA